MWMKTRCAAVSVLTFLLLACSQAADKISPSAAPTQALSLAAGYVSGSSEIPADHFLFILVKSESTGSGTCDFPVVEQAPLTFWYSSGALEINSSGSTGWQTDPNLVDVDGPEIKGLGFFGYLSSNDYSLGGGIHDEIYYIIGLPFDVPSMSFVIHSILKDGTVVAGVQEKVYQFEPGQSWVQVSTYKDERFPECQIKNTFSITNIGILDRSALKFSDEPIFP